MGRKMDLDTLWKGLLICSSIGSIFISIGIYMTKIRSHEDKINKIEEQLKARLYKEDGSPIYMSAERCKESRDGDRLLRDGENNRIWDEMKLLRKAIEDLPDKMDHKLKEAIKMLIDSQKNYMISKRPDA